MTTLERLKNLCDDSYNTTIIVNQSLVILFQTHNIAQSIGQIEKIVNSKLPDIETHEKYILISCILDLYEAGVAKVLL